MEKSPDYIWMNGELVPWQDARLHVTSEAILRGGSVFEGLRAYPDASGRLNLFRVPEHLRRLRQSARIMRMPIGYSDAELTAGFCDLVRACEFQETIHLRITAYFGEGKAYSWEPEDIANGVFIFAAKNPTRKSVWEGISSGTSTWRRNSDVAAPSRVKSSANYHNSRLAQVEATKRGFDVPIMLSDDGHVAETPSSCVFMVRDGVLYTPGVSEDILESVTRDTLIQLAEQTLGVKVVERRIDRSELYIADELFICGSGHEVLPIRIFDDYEVGNGGVGSLTALLRDLYFDAVCGRLAGHMNWLTPIAED